MKENITLQELRIIGACSIALNAFESQFGIEASIESLLSEIRKRKKSSWEGWLLAQECTLTEVLINHGFDVHAEDDLALRMASEYGLVEVVKLLIEHGANVHAFNDSALWWATRYGNTKVVKILFKHGANVHASDNGALRLASLRGRTKMVKILLEHGANVHAGGNDCALLRARKYGHTEVVNLLEKAMSKAA